MDGYKLNIMNKQEVIDLMKSSKSKQEWNSNCDKVKAACGGYPKWWYGEIVMQGIAEQVANTWGGTAEIKITSF